MSVLVNRLRQLPVKQVLQGLILAAALFFLGGVLYRQWDQVRAYPWRLDWPWLAGSFVVLVVTWLLLVGLWRWLLGRLGGPLGLAQAWRIWWLSNIIRYIPGNVWQYLGMVYLCQEAGIGQVQTLTSVILHQAVSVGAGLVVAGAYFLLTLRVEPQGGAWELTLATKLLPFLVALPVALFLLQPRVFGRAINALLVRLGRPPIRFALTSRDLLALFVAHVISWLLYGLGFYLFVRAAYAVELGELPRLGAAFAAAYVIGFLSLLTPSGLGVREGVLLYLLSLSLPLPVATVLAVASRLWLIAGELASTAGALLVPRDEVRVMRYE